LCKEEPDRRRQTLSGRGLGLRLWLQLVQVIDGALRVANRLE
jgi:hypothetical protein